jgi:hypothetical protein
MKTILVCRLHICDYVAVGSLYGITLLMLSVSEMPDLSSIVKVPCTCVCSTLYGSLVLLPHLQGFSFFLKYPLSRDSCIDNAFDFLSLDFHLLDVLIFVWLCTNQQPKEY